MEFLDSEASLIKLNRSLHKLLPDGWAQYLRGASVASVWRRARFSVSAGVDLLSATVKDNQKQSF